MQIFVQNLENATLALELEPAATIKAVKEVIEEREDVPCEDQVLSFAGKLRDCVGLLLVSGQFGYVELL